MVLECRPGRGPVTLIRPVPVSVIVPRAGDCPHRERAWAWVKTRLDGLEVVEGWGDPDLWCKADAVADGLSRASGDVLVIHDADVYSGHLAEVIHAVEAGDYQWGAPHRSVYRLTEQGTQQFFDGERERPLTSECHHAVLGGGIVVVTRAKYEQAPLDPRFVGWGGEDQAWCAALMTIAGKPLILRQPLYHLYHPPQPRMTRKVGNVANDELRGRYIGARLVAKRMRDLIEEGRCHSNVSSQPTR